MSELTEFKFVWSAVTTGEKIDLPPEYEDLAIAILLNLVKDAMILESSVVYEDLLDAEYIGED